MKKADTIIIFVILLIMCNFGYAKTIDAPYEIGTWPGFRQAAISYTFDDGNSNQFEIAIPMFDEYGFKLTMFTVTDWVSQRWAALKSAASYGHEIAGHTVTHPSLDTISKEKQEIELKSSKEAIDANIPGSKCITLAYPNCRVGDVSICQKYYIAARGCQGFVEKSTPANFMNISSIICGSRGPLKTAEDFEKKFNETVNSNGWCVLLLHGIDDDGGYSPLPSTVLRETLEYLKDNKSTYWVETFVNVVRYIRQRDTASVKELPKQQDSITIQVTDTLDDDIYNYPLTIRRPLPDNWPAVTISQNNKTVDVNIVEVESRKYIMFDVVPDRGDVLLSKSNEASIGS